jgi:hypothetical protein
MYFAVFSGGEPYIKRDLLLRIFKNTMICFLTFTTEPSSTKRHARNLTNWESDRAIRWKLGAETMHAGERHVGKNTTVNCKSLEGRGPLCSTLLLPGTTSTLLPLKPSFEHFLNEVHCTLVLSCLCRSEGSILVLVPTPEHRVLKGKGVLRRLRDRYPCYWPNF